MKTFDVYPLFNIEPVKAKGSYIWDKNGKKYLDFYGGHAVISVGHSHPHYINKLNEQLKQIGFYSNSVQIPQQEVLAEKLGKLSSYLDYQLFLCNSGAEANENAMKLASFHTGRKKVIAFTNSFHGRTSLAVAATDDTSIVAPINQTDNIIFLSFNDENCIEQITEEIAAVIIEGIQGVGGIQVPDNSFLQKLEAQCKKTGTLLILDEVQSGYGRTGKFFAHQHGNIKPDLITVAKGMGNGFPIAGVLISPEINAKHGMLGTTFGGNHLACAAGIAVLDIIEKENLVENAEQMGDYIFNVLKNKEGIKFLRGKGLMIGIDTEANATEIRKQLLFEFRIFTGYSSSTKTIRLLPALNITKTEADFFLESLNAVLTTNKVLS
ncbi:MAG TPA: aminotransferase class III-fold pyridoxal phosphate-dependent enzyme [Bacteroidia bacterium]|jgi:acetylornithine/N-succinyldiaminopimelate aminotransferase|nr:aminotransferase class III-fold pyridoxal phosphate-dependent enzyme [Bacteroidia bacterium]